MSNKLNLSDLQRDAAVSLTQQLVDRFVDAIETQTLEPGEKLPTTRALAAEAGVNHLTAARVYRRLAELGYVTATVGRGTFVRSLVPAAAEEQGDDWQIWAMPEPPQSYTSQIVDDAFRMATDPDVISLSTGFPSPELYPVEDLARASEETWREVGGEAISYLVAEGLYELREQLAVRGRKAGWAESADEIIVTSGARQALDIVVRALLGPDDVAGGGSPTYAGILSSLRGTGARVIGVPVDKDGLDT